LEETMNDFELRRELRELRAPRETARDLWPEIARKIAAESNAATTPRRRLARWPLAVAAGVVLALTFGLFSLHPTGRGTSSAGAEPAYHDGPDVSEQIQHARDLAATGDPRLASAEVVLDAASNELDHALEQQPDAVFLVGLINRTHAQRRKLARLGIDAG
jgi:hypothetical protein